MADRQARARGELDGRQVQRQEEGRRLRDVRAAARHELRRPPRSPAHHKKLDRETYETELEKLQVELVRLQEWIKHAGLRVAVIFEGRDAAGKGGTIKRVTEHLNPRVVRIAALATPTERERTEWYFQRYVSNTCRPPARWSSSTAPGTTGPASSA